MANQNRVRNGGFEQSTPPGVGPFWSPIGGAVSETGVQLLGDNNGRLPAAGDSISQPLKPLEVGQIYQFQAAFSTDSASTGTIDVDITGITTRSFQGANIEASEEYVYYSFDFKATVASPTLTITNNTNSNVVIDVVSVKLANPNRIRNGGFEQSAPPALPPFWSGNGSTETGGTQLLGDNNVRLNMSENISQTLLPLQVGERYTFQAAFFTNATTGTIDIGITGITTRNFQGFKVNSSDYSYYSFDFKATVASPTLTITNNTDSDVTIDVVSVKLANLNHVRNGGFEQSTPPVLPPFWSGNGSTETGGTQLLGDNNARLNVGENISQALLPLQVGEIYRFQAAFEVSGGGTVDIGITGITTRQFKGDSMVDGNEYAYYSFDFKATVASPTLTITNNTLADVIIDVVSVKLA
ncbi:hypothetical protein [Metabacillus sediminilitoris]|uniref:Uncharacterized protein n=1 Tax=Metabacillus sediminilitoris TaxID=2567941 RepID=A0A4S4BXJ8_9BACI|nr:hypothetical protein [Metabacillus sediminilitoris]QGQ46188.1 hypothetical protein GMB29_13760 [Metabacillus sediminilitoris]THF79241.1 hypothetical protein E6W99_12870 [Metabacillus sediminilitoris]